MTLQELLAVDEGSDCPGCPVCRPPKPKGGGAPRSVSVLIERGATAFSVRYTDARIDPAGEEGVTRPSAPVVAVATREDGAVLPHRVHENGARPG